MWNSCTKKKDKYGKSLIYLAVPCDTNCAPCKSDKLKLHIFFLKQSTAMKLFSRRDPSTFFVILLSHKSTFISLNLQI